jgi:hypothetical protein
MKQKKLDCKKRFCEIRFFCVLLQMTKIMGVFAIFPSNNDGAADHLGSRSIRKFAGMHTCCCRAMQQRSQGYLWSIELCVSNGYEDTNCHTQVLRLLKD